MFATASATPSAFQGMALTILVLQYLSDGGMIRVAFLIIGFVAIFLCIWLLNNFIVILVYFIIISAVATYEFFSDDRMGEFGRYLPFLIPLFFVLFVVFDFTVSVDCGQIIEIYGGNHGFVERFLYIPARYISPFAFRVGLVVGYFFKMCRFVLQ